VAGNGIAPGAPADVMLLDYTAISKDMIIEADGYRPFVYRSASFVYGSESGIFGGDCMAGLQCGCSYLRRAASG
jgi:hypothetical protein